MEIALDHIVYAAADLEDACRVIAEATDCEPEMGGPHVGLGTRNALLAFEGGSYLEIIAPDPEQPPAANLAARLAELEAPELFHWALRVDDLGAMAAALRDTGHEPTPAIETSRKLPDGRLLVWDLMGLPGTGGVWPFFIDWRDCPHPSESAPRVGALRGLGVSLPVEDPASLPFAGVAGVALSAGVAALTVAFETGRGVVEWGHHEPKGFFS